MFQAYDSLPSPTQSQEVVDRNRSLGPNLNLLVMLGLHEKAVAQIHLCIMLKYEESKKIKGNQKEVRKIFIFRTWLSVAAVGS